MAGHYRIHAFARLAGVTVKALRHYDRLGLLKPARTGSGHRVYAERDLERLEQVVALRFIGLSLKQIRQVLDRGDLPLADALARQRQVLTGQRGRIDRAIAAIGDVERRLAGGAPRAAILRQLIEVIGRQDADDVEVMKRYYSERAWEKWAHHYRDETADPALLALLADGNALVGTDPAAEPAQSLLTRWGEYWIRAAGRDPEIFEGMRRAWYDRDNWPPAIRARASAAEPLMRFLGEVAWERMAIRCEGGSSRFSFPHRGAESRIAFYREVEGALDEGPGSTRARALARRWDTILDSEARGDAGHRVALEHAWRSRDKWPPFMRAWVAGCYMMSESRWEQVSRFLEDAR